MVEGLRDGSERPLVPEVDWARVDATTEAEIAAQIAEDDAEAMRDAAAYARRVRRKVGLSQAAFAGRIGVPVDTVAQLGAEQASAARSGPRRCSKSSSARPEGHLRLRTGPDRAAGPFVSESFPSPSDARCFPPRNPPVGPRLADAGTDSHGPMDPPNIWFTDLRLRIGQRR